MKIRMLKKELRSQAKNNEFKPNYKDTGVCLRIFRKEQITRSKFRNEKDAQEFLHSLRSINVVNLKYVTYKCPECHTWHIGLKEWENKD